MDPFVIGASLFFLFAVVFECGFAYYLLTKSERQRAKEERRRVKSQKSEM